MSKQFDDVNCKNGAPMGRSACLKGKDQPARCFRVHLDSGGYDDGGAYWGFGDKALYCAKNEAGLLLFTRADSRKEAKEALQTYWKEAIAKIRWVN